MEQNTNKDKWIEEILSSSDSIKRVSAGPYLFPKILSRLKDNKNRYGYIPIKRAAIGFITIVLLAIINVFVVFNSGNSTMNIRSENTKTESSSQFIPSQYNPYLEIIIGN